ncbi:Site-specific recombinase XerD [Haladaptatus litoreus]|uniref:Site-specific recombinase XerD n=1 Tax=Haladaptatus litoreus TaxID=553468 RepID=A0A1N7E693_9EURY|nr:tyrosine-type recombinase/integrase [Haladaptatus litoreus]SIR83536.1 Site-specific recombinase XerD [Haladaptatus litoreus]
MTGTTLTAAIEEYLSSIEAGNYRTNAGSALTQWSEWLARERTVTQLNDVEVIDCRRYARHLKRQVREDELKSSTAHTYYAYVRAFLGFCEADELLSRNPAAVSRAQAELPENTADANRQFWSERDRKAILAFMDRRVEQALETDGDSDGNEISRERAYRDRALVRLLALSGVRGAEVFRAPADDKRPGITWRDVDIEGGSLRVFGKSREYEYAQLPKKAAEALERYHRVSDPPTPRFPVFPTDHAPSKYRAVREQLTGEYTESRIETILDENDIDDVVREYEIVIPAISTRGARNLMKRLCKEAGLDIDGEYLKPHGARRGLGHQLYSEGHAELAQSALRHASIATTHESYSNIRASETAERVDDVLDDS